MWDKLTKTCNLKLLWLLVVIIPLEPAQAQTPLTIPQLPTLSQSQSPLPQFPPGEEVINNEKVIEDTPAQITPEETTDINSINPDPNPLNRAGDSLDRLIQMQMNDDIWMQMKGDLPCAEATTDCISQLQELAGQNNALLVEIDAKIFDIEAKIDEARASNRTAINLSVFEPALQILLRQDTVINQDTKQPQRIGFIERIGQLFTSPVPLLNELFNAVGIPLIRKVSGGNDQQRQSAIAISDLQIKVAQMQRDRAQLADTIREKIYLAVFDLDDAIRKFQISQEIAKRSVQRMQIIQIEYRLGEGETENYLAQISSLDGKKAATYKAWTATRSRLEKLKLLVLGVNGL